MKNNYAKCLVTPRRKRKPDENPFPKDKAGKGGNNTQQIRITTYKTNQGQFYDLARLIYTHEQLKENTVTVEITPGTYDVTKWARIRRVFGRSEIQETNPDFTPLAFSGYLEDYYTKHITPFTVQLRIARTEINNRADILKILQDIEGFRETLLNASDDELEFYWRIRNSLQNEYQTKANKYKARTLIWQECIQRFQCTNKPLRIKLPFFNQLDAAKVKRFIYNQINNLTWPEYIKNWHKAQFRISTSSQANIADILNNVTRRNKPTKCNCQQIIEKLNDAGCKPIPTINSHIFFISRDYKGPHQTALQVGANNIPTQSFWDLKRSWERLHGTLPGWIKFDKDEWIKGLSTCTIFKEFVRNDDFPSTKDVYSLRKITEGLVVGPIDKNPNELSFCCPCLYEQAWEKAYDDKAGYKQIYPHRHNRVPDESGVVFETSDLHKGGEEKDLIKNWETIYRKKKWNRYATFDKKGGFNVPYLLFKAKNITDIEIREKKWEKARPIAPQTKHPMRR